MASLLLWKRVVFPLLLHLLILSLPLCQFMGTLLNQFSSQSRQKALYFAACGFSDRLLNRTNPPKVRQASKALQISRETLLHLKEQGMRHRWQMWEGWENRLWVGVVGVSEGGRLQWEDLSHLKLLPRGCTLCASSWDGCDHSCLLPHSINIVWLHYKIVKL